MRGAPAAAAVAEGPILCAMIAPVAALGSLLVLAPQLAGPPGAAPLRVTIRAGEKTHGPGEHDHPRFLEEWSVLLEERGAEVEGALAFPSAETLARTDVLVMYAAEGGSIHGAERAALEEYLGRGGGIVVVHDAACGDDPPWFRDVVGGAWEHGRSKWYEGEIGLYLADREHPITRGVSNFDLEDEIYWDLHVSPDAHVLANGFHTPFDVTPQMWVYEKDAYRAFVTLQGHEWTTFSHPAWRALLLRGIAWAGRRDADLLVAPDELAALRYPPGGPRAPEEARAAFAVHPDFEVELFAAEPLVVNPVSIDWDPRGRAWVACTPGYPYKEESSGVPAHDEVVILADRDGDGRADERTVFAEGLDLVTSLVHHRDGVIVTQAPEILWLRDRDGDDRADERVVLFRGFGYGDTHAVTSNLRLGLDGWVYGTQGYSGSRSDVVGADGRRFGRVPNGLFRFRPDGSAIETVVSYGSNTWGCDFTADGELFYTMANGSHLRHVVLPDAALAEARLGEAPSWVDVTDHSEVLPLTRETRAPYVQIDFVGGFTAAAGSLVYTAGAWPEELAGNHFVCEPTVNLVHRDVLAPSGPTFRASRPGDQEFLASTDLWFRPVHLRTGPDGQLYVLDLYNQAAIHNDTRGPRHGPTNAAVRPDRDRLHGRIWRVRHRGAAARPAPDLARAGFEERLAALAHPDRWWRMTAQRLLVEDADLAGDAGRLEALARLAREGAPLARVHAAWTLQQHGRLEPAVVAGLLGSAEPALRKNGVRLHRLAGGSDVAALVPLLADPDPRVRFEALAALEGRDVGADVARELLALFPGLADDWSRSAVLGALAGAPARHLELLLASDPAGLAPLARELARRVRRPEEVAAALAELARREPAAPTELALAVLEGLAAEGREAQQLPDDLAVADALARLLGDARIEVSIAALPFAARVPAGGEALAPRVAELTGRLLTLIEDPDRPLELRLACLSVLLGLEGHGAQGVAAAQRFLDPYFAADVQAGVVDRLGAAAEEPALEAAVVDALVAAVPRLSTRARERAFHHMLARPPRALRLLQRLADGTLARGELGPQRVHRLRNHGDPEVAARAAELLGAAGAEGAESERVERLIAELLPVVEAPGDAGRGREVFRTSCATCHSIDGLEEGAHVGPELTGMGAHGARALLSFLLDPNRAVEEAYLEYAVETTDGRTLAGIVASESERGIVLRSSSGEELVERDRIADLRSTGRSPMPTGFEELGAEALRDLLAFLGAGYERYRLIDLKPLCNSSTRRGLYDERRDVRPMRFREYGVVDVEGVPFEILDPARVGDDALVLRGGMAPDWDSKLHRPQEVVVPVGFPLERVHVLGGIAAWGFPFTQSRAPILRWTWVYADGTEEALVLQDGERFADWIRRHDVPGSEFVDLLEEESWGQVRRFTLDPGRRDVAVRGIRLESFDNHLAPTFLALTAQLAGADDEPPVPAPRTLAPEVDVLVLGGGTSHDYHRWFHEEDFRTLAELGPRLAYTELPGEVLALLPRLSLLALCNNQPLPDPALRAGILEHVRGGGSLLLLHAATWHNWPDWPEFNALLVGGGARSHEAYGELEVRPAASDHPVLRGVTDPFRVEDELYRFEPDPAAPLEVLATGRSLTSGAEYPVLWTLRHGAGRIVGLTLGHDGAAHESPAFRALLLNAARWLLSDRPPSPEDAK